MRKVLLSVALLVGLAVTVRGQHGSAPNGYYPIGYSGDMWTGEVTAVNDPTREITLSYNDTRHHKSETFVGVVQEGYKIRVGTPEEHELKVSEIPLGTRLSVLYMPKTKKVDGKKIKYYEIFRIASAPPDKR